MGSFEDKATISDTGLVKSKKARRSILYIICPWFYDVKKIFDLVSFASLGSSGNVEDINSAKEKVDTDFQRSWKSQPRNPMK